MAPVIGSAVTAADALHARQWSYRKAVERAEAIICEALARGAFGVSYSGGKDSTVVLDLVRRTDARLPAALFDSGCELSATLTLAAHYGVEIIQPRLTAPEMARYAGWWGYPQPVDAGCPFELKAVIIDEPSETFVVSRRLVGVFVGLRQEESHGRAMNRRTRGTLYRGSDRTWYATPIADWSVDDVWAYIAERGLRYHPAYDVMAQMGIPREQARLGMQLGAKAERVGSIAVLRRADPDLFARLSSEFPGLRASA